MGCQHRVLHQVLTGVEGHRGGLSAGKEAVSEKKPAAEAADPGVNRNVQGMCLTSSRYKTSAPDEEMLQHRLELERGAQDNKGYGSRKDLPQMLRLLSGKRAL